MSPVAAAVRNRSVSSADVVGVDRFEALPAGMHVFARPVRDLANGGRRFADGRGDFVVTEAEHFAQHEHRPLVGTEGLQHHEHRHRHRLGKHHVGGRIPVVEH